MLYGLPIGAFLASILVLVPIPGHWRARNVSTLAITFWLFICNLTIGINAIIWGNDAVIRIAVWCDIVTKLQVGATIALPAACFCLCLRLASVASVTQAKVTEGERTRRMVLDGALCFALPCVYMALHVIVQGHRFDIVEGFGCRPVVYESIPAIFVFFLPPLLLDLGTCACASFALVHFYKRRANFAKHLQDSNSALTPSRYIRLMAMCSVEVIWGLLVTSLNMWFTCRLGLRPWTSWSDVHWGFGQIGQYPLVLIPASQLSWTLFIWWTVPISAIIFFLFFAFGQDAMREYRSCFVWFMTKVFRHQAKDTVLGASFRSHTLPPPVSAYAPKPFKLSINASSSATSTSPDSLQTAITLNDSDYSDITPKVFDEKTSLPCFPSPTYQTSQTTISMTSTLEEDDCLQDIPSSLSLHFSNRLVPASHTSRPVSLQSLDVRNLYIQTYNNV